jgi:ABC-2 type transport system ATP-binding protein
MLQLISVSKKYGDYLALDNINMNLSGGQIAGLIGPNGAGKTTLLRILSALLGVNGGRILYKGKEIHTKDIEYREKIGYLPEEGGLYANLTPLQNLLFYRSFYNQAIPETTMYEYLREFNLTEVQNRQTGKLSKGTRQKILFLKALLNDPELLVLDEPLNYLDPEIRIRIKLKLKELSAAGKLVLLSSHTLFEVEDLCTTIIIIQRGRIITTASLADLKHRYAITAERSLESIYLRIIGER